MARSGKVRDHEGPAPIVVGSNTGIVGTISLTVFPAVSISVSAAGNRSPEVIANALSTGSHRMNYRALPTPVGSRERVSRYRHFIAACSEGKWPRAVIAPIEFKAIMSIPADQAA